MSGAPRRAPRREPEPRHWQFHRLRPEWADAVVEAAHVRPGQLVIDLGAGDGRLTLPLLAAGVRVIAVELHPSRADRLRRAVDGRDASVVTMDLAAFSFPGRPCRVVANPPFALAATLVRALARHPSVTAADLVLPVDVVRRVVRRGVRGMEASMGLTLPASAFTPAAPRACGVLRLRRIGSPRRSHR